MKVLFSILLFCAAFLYNVNFVCAQQTAYKSEDDLKKHANELFENEEYGEALPLFSQLLSLYSKDPNYNYKFAVCLLLATEDKEKPVQFLEYASRNPDTEKEVWFFLGKAYQLNYRFFDAEKAYKKYKELISGKQNKKLDVDRAIETCNNGKFLMNKVNDIKVLDKKEIALADFFRAYSLEGLKGKLVVKPEDFMTPIDIKKKQFTVIYVSPGDKEVYFSSYGESDKNSKDIYKVIKLPTGEFGKPINLGPIINTPYDEDYAFMQPDGKTLYFSSKGHNSMGGYDIFKSTYTAETNTWTKPENLDFPISSPDDDIMLVAETESQVAYFASRRTATQGNTNVYKIEVELTPHVVALIKGTFKWPDNAPVPTKITVKNIINGHIEGTYKVSEKGEYLLSVPNGGSFQFIVEADSYQKFTDVVEVPASEEFKLLKQGIEIQKDVNSTKMVITNSFNELIASEDQIIDAFKQRARLEINTDPTATANATKTNPANNTSKENSTTNTTSKENTTPAKSGDLVKLAYDDAKISETEADKIKVDVQRAFSIANEKNELAKQQYNEGQAALTAANAISDETEKGQKIKSANDKLTEASVNYQKAAVAYELGKSLEDDYSKKKTESEVDMQYAKQLETFTKTGQGNDVLEKLEDQKDKLESDNNNLGTSNKTSIAKEKAEVKQNELNKIESQIAEYKKEIDEIGTEQDNLNTQASKTKDKQLKETFKTQIGDLEVEKTERKLKLEDATKNLEQVKADAAKANAEASYVTDIVSDVTSDKVIAASTVDKYQLKSNIEANKNIDAGTYVAYANTQTAASNNTTSTNTSSENTNATVSTAEITGPEMSAINNKLPKQYANNEPYTSADEDVAKANKIVDEKERQAALAKIYNNLDMIITDQINSEKEKLVTAKDAEAKAEVQSNIDKLLVAQILIKEDYAKTQAPIASTSNITNTSENVNNTATNNSNTAATNNTTTENTATSANVPAAVVEINKKYDEELSAIDEFVEEKDRPKSKVELNNKFIDNIDKEIVKGKADAQNARSEAEKARAEETVAKLETRKQELIVKNDELKKADPNLAFVSSQNSTETNTNNITANNAATNNATETNTTANNTNTQTTVDTASANRTTAPTVNATSQITALKERYNKANFAYNAEMSDIKSIPNESARNKATIASDERLVKELDAIVADYRAMFDGATLEQQKDIVQEIKLYEGLEKVKNDEIASLKTTAENNTTAANNNTNNNTSTENTNTNTSTENTNTAAVNNNAGTDVAADLFPEELADQKVNYTNTKVRSVLANLRQDSQDKNALDAKADEVFKTSATVSGDEKNKLILESDSIRAEAGKKQIEINNKIAEANKIEFEGNVETLKTLVAANKSNGADDATIAVLQAEDANALFGQALLARSQAQNANDPVTKKDAQQRAFALEKSAIEKQQEALKSFKNISNTSTAKVNSTNNNTNTSTENNTVATNTATNNTNTTNNNNTSAETSNVNFSSTEDIKNMKEYKSYVDLKNEAAQNLDKSIQEKQNQDRLNKEAQEMAAFAVFSEQKAASATNDADKASNIAKADSLKAASEQRKVKAVEAETASENYKAAAAQKNNEADEFIQTLDRASYEKVKVVYSNENKDKATALNTLNNGATNNTASNANTTENNNTNAANNNVATNNSNTNATTSTNKTQPKNLKEVDEFFEKATAPVYSSANPIPINVEIPSGLIFKVQVGAFRNPIPQDLFKGFNPITGETTPSGLTRYSAGIFKSFKNADLAKTEIRGFGYNDAFVVAYFNGKRISFAEAMSMLNKIDATNTNTIGTTAKEELTNFVQNQPNNNAVAANNTTPVNNAQTNTNVNTTANTNNTIPANAASFTNLNTTVGYAYTVQVGVYSKAVTPDKLFNVQPLYVENTSNGFMRYTSGIYSSVGNAIQAKNIIVSLGITDAFVVAYKDGRRVTMADAKQAEATGGAGVFVKSPDLNKMPFRSNGGQSPAITNTQTPVVNNNTPAVNNNTPTVNETLPVVNNAPPATNNNNATSDVGVVYKVQLGAFREEVPNDIAALFFKVSSKGVEHYFEQEQKLTIYTVGKVKTLEAAEQLKAEVIAVGLKDAFVVAYENGKKIDLETAKKITGN